MELYVCVCVSILVLPWWETLSWFYQVSPWTSVGVTLSPIPVSARHYFLLSVVCVYRGGPSSALGRFWHGVGWMRSWANFCMERRWTPPLLGNVGLSLIGHHQQMKVRELVFHSSSRLMMVMDDSCSSRWMAPAQVIPSHCFCPWGSLLFYCLNLSF